MQKPNLFVQSVIENVIKEMNQDLIQEKEELVAQLKKANERIDYLRDILEDIAFYSDTLFTCTECGSYIDIELTPSAVRCECRRYPEIYCPECVEELGEEDLNVYKDEGSVTGYYCYDCDKV